MVHHVYGSGHTQKRWSTLNPRHPLTLPLIAYARELSKRYASEPLHQMPPSEFPRTADLPEIRPELPGKSTKLRIIMAVFECPGLDVQALRRRTGELDHKRITAWLRKLAAAGLIMLDMNGARVSTAPNREFAAAEALSQLVTAIADFLRFNQQRASQ